MRPVGLRLVALTVHAHQILGREAEEVLEHALGLLVPPFAEVVIANDAFTVDEVEGGPVPVVERPPDRVAAVSGSELIHSVAPARHGILLSRWTIAVMRSLFVFAVRAGRLSRRPARLLS